MACISIASPAHAEWMDDGWPNADLAVVDIGYNFVGMPIMFDALGTADGDTGLLRFEWDLNGDGVYGDSDETVAVTEYTYDTVGPHTVFLRVTDPEFEVSSTTSIVVNIVPGGDESFATPEQNKEYADQVAALAAETKKEMEAQSTTASDASQRKQTTTKSDAAPTWLWVGIPALAIGSLLAAYFLFMRRRSTKPAPDSE